MAEEKTIRIVKRCTDMDDDSFPYLALDRKVPTAIFGSLTQAGAVDSFEIDEE